MKTTLNIITRLIRISAAAASILAISAGHTLANDHDDDDHHDKNKKKEKADDHQKPKEAHHGDVVHKDEVNHGRGQSQHPNSKEDVKRTAEVHHSQAEPHHKDEVSHQRVDSHNSREIVTHHSSHSDAERRQIFMSHSRKSYALCYGDGYAGRGYYYGPRGASYYFEIPGVTFYRERRLIPREYQVIDESYNIGSMDARVQRELAYRGYYDGDIDGEIGPASRRAIYAFQRDNGLRATGVITGDLLDALDING